MLVVIRGAGDIASGIAMRLRRSGFCVVMTDVARPTAIRRTVSFSGAIISGSQRVEDVTARLAHTPEAALGTIQQATRRYAKRQMTWFRANPAVQWLDASAGADEIFRAALQKAADFDSGI